MTGQRSERTVTPPRLLRRRTMDRVLGGVAGGLGDYFNIDPLLIRIGFVGLMIFGGAGLVLYVLGWLLIPAEAQDSSLLEDFFRRLGPSARFLGWIAIVIVAVVAVQAALTPGGYISIGPGVGIDLGALLAIGVVAAGVLLLRRRDGTAAPPMVAPQATSAALEAEVMKAPPRPRSPLAWYVYGAVLLTVGLLAIVSQVAEREVSPGQFFGAALTVIGIGLVVGAWWGRARILMLVAILVAPIAIAASFIAAPLEGGIGYHRYTPVTMAEVRDEYRSLGGRTILDLQDLQTSPRIIHIAASVAVGELVVILPEGASVELRARVGAGDSWFLGTRDAGTSLDNRYVRRHSNETTYILDLEMGIGTVFVTDSRINW